MRFKVNDAAEVYMQSWAREKDKGLGLHSGKIDVHRSMRSSDAW